jgi:hypothetical protein
MTDGPTPKLRGGEVLDYRGTGDEREPRSQWPSLIGFFVALLAAYPQMACAGIHLLPKGWNVAGGPLLWFVLAPLAALAVNLYTEHRARRTRG